MLTCLRTIEKENKKVFNEGKRECIQEGIQEGIQECTLEIIKNMIKENFSIEVISKITGLSCKDIDKIIIQK